MKSNNLILWSFVGAFATASVFTGTGCSFFRKETVLASKPAFNEAAAYESILKQEAFGPRPVGSEAHSKYREWILNEIKDAHKVIKNDGEMPSFGKTVPVHNIMAQLWPDKKKRILLSAHYDTRPFADKDSSSTNKSKPIIGANDGASGVAVLLSLYNALKALPDFPLGIDFMFWDAEDLGKGDNPYSYCLGSQFWANKKVPENYNALLNINYDMVGRMGSVFPMEVGSERYAPEHLRKFWKIARDLGYGDYFSNDRVGPIIDDHAIVAENAGIPAFDIIYMMHGPKFAPEWHTMADRSDVISRDTLDAVGETTLGFLWNLAAEQN